MSRLSRAREVLNERIDALIREESLTPDAVLKALAEFDAILGRKGGKPVELTPEEREELRAEREALRDALDDPGARELIAALKEDDPGILTDSEAEEYLARHRARFSLIQ